MNTKQQKNKTTRCKPENHLVLLTKQESGQHRHKTIQLHCLDCKQTTQETRTARTRAQNINNKLPFNQLNSKNTRIAGKTVFFHRLKAKLKLDRKQTKQDNYQKRNQHRNRKAETYAMKTETKTTEEKRGQKAKKKWDFEREDKRKTKER